MRPTCLLLPLLAAAPLCLACVELNVTQTVGAGGKSDTTTVVVGAGTGGGGGAAGSADGGAGGGGCAVAEGGAAGSGGAGGAPRFCGDGGVNGGEQCDGSPFPAECEAPGSANECMFPPPVPTILTCPGEDVQIGSGQSLVIGPYDNTTGGDDQIGTCVAESPGGRDHVFNFEALATGTLTLTVGNDPGTGQPWCQSCSDGCPDGGGCWIPVIYVRSGACQGASAVEMAC